MLRRSLSYLMKGKEMMCHQHSKEDCPYSLTASNLMEMEAILKRLTATTTLMVPKVTSDSLEGLGLQTATYTAQQSQGKFSDTGCKANRNGLLSPDGNSVVKSPAFLEGLFKKSFCSTKQVTLFLSS